MQQELRPQPFATEERTMGDDNVLPALYDHLVVHLPCCGGEPHESHLELRRADELVIAPPVHHPYEVPAAPYAAGSPVVVGWAVAPNGWAELATTFVVDTDPADRVWRVARHGGITVVQRRDYARVSHHVPMRLRIDEEWHEGLLVDIGEGGLSCAVPGDLTRLVPGRPVHVALTIGADAVVLAAHAVRAEVVASGETVVAVCFEELTPRMSDQIRKDVFSLQLQQRARGAA